MRPGVLFSALQACRASGSGDNPTKCLVICSRDTEGLITEAAGQAGYEGAVKPMLLGDAFGGNQEIERLVKEAKKHLIGADEVLVNVTGGTTLMGLTAEALANAARELSCPVRRFGLIDKRPPNEQDDDPYQVGEPFWLDSAEKSDADDH